MSVVLGAAPGSSSQEPKHPDDGGGSAAVFLAILRQHGPSVVISLWFTYWLTSQVSAAITSVQRDLTTHTHLSSFYSRQICINTANSPAQVAACEPPIVLQGDVISAGHMMTAGVRHDEDF